MSDLLGSGGRGEVKLPPALLSLAANREELLTTLELLENAQESVIRADLASELVGICSRYEDVHTRAVYPALREAGGLDAAVDGAEKDQSAIRDALGKLRHRTQHLRPVNAYVDDPQGFEDDLRDAIAAIGVHLHHEEQVILPAIEGLNGPSSEALRRRVEDAVAHASTHPSPPHNPVARAVSAIGEWLEREIKDESQSWHPGVDKLTERLASSAHEQPGDNEVDLPG